MRILVGWWEKDEEKHEKRLRTHLKPIQKPSKHLNNEGEEKKEKAPLSLQIDDTWGEGELLSLISSVLGHEWAPHVGPLGPTLFISS